MTIDAADRRPDDTELARLRESVAAPGRRSMTRREALSWERRWSASDTQIVTRHLDRVGAVRFSRTADDSYVRCVDSADRLVMVIARGYLVFPRQWANHECAPDWRGIALSTFGVRPGPAASPAPTRTPAKRTPRRHEPEPAFCPRCFLQLTTTGVCGNCD